MVESVGEIQDQLNSVKEQIGNLSHSISSIFQEVSFRKCYFSSLLYAHFSIIAEVYTGRQCMSRQRALQLQFTVTHVVKDTGVMLRQVLKKKIS